MSRIRKGWYLITTDGTIYSEKSHKIVTPQINYGYKKFSYKLNGKLIPEFIHRLVYRTFVGEIPEGMTINHIDGNKLNNSVENLECITLAENVRHSFSVLGNNNGVKKRKIKDHCSILAIITTPITRRYDICKIYGMSNQNLCAIRRGGYEEFEEIAKSILKTRVFTRDQKRKPCREDILNYFNKREFEINNFLQTEVKL